MVKKVYYYIDIFHSKPTAQNPPIWFQPPPLGSRPDWVLEPASNPCWASPESGTMRSRERGCKMAATIQTLKFTHKVKIQVL